MKEAPDSFRVRSENPFCKRCGDLGIIPHPVTGDEFNEFIKCPDCKNWNKEGLAQCQ